MPYRSQSSFRRRGGQWNDTVGLRARISRDDPNVTSDGTEPTGPESQAARIIRRFGGIRRLVLALQRLGPDRAVHRITVWKWKRKGQIPARAQRDVLEAARLEGILLAPEDFWPGAL